MLAAVRQDRSVFGTDVEGGQGNLLFAVIRILQEFAERILAKILDSLVAHSFAAVARDRVSDFVRHDNSQASFCLADGQHP